MRGGDRLHPLEVWICSVVQRLATKSLLISLAGWICCKFCLVSAILVLGGLTYIVDVLAPLNFSVRLGLARCIYNASSSWQSEAGTVRGLIMKCSKGLHAHLGNLCLSACCCQCVAIFYKPFVSSIKIPFLNTGPLRTTPCASAGHTLFVCRKAQPWGITWASLIRAYWIAPLQQGRFVQAAMRI